MNKINAVILAFFMAITLTGCGSDDVLPPDSGSGGDIADAPHSRNLMAK